MTLRMFLLENLSPPQREGYARGGGPRLHALLNGDVQDSTFVAWLMGEDSDACHLFMWLLTSSQFVRVLRLRCRFECATPCRLADFSRLPCRWSETVLASYGKHLLARQAEALGPFLERFQDQGLITWLCLTLHAHYHPEQLDAHGFPALSETDLPRAVRALFAEDGLYRTLFEMRWLRGVTEEAALSTLISPPLSPAALEAALCKLDDTLLKVGAFEPLWRRLDPLRAASGIPLRRLSWTEAC